MAQLPAILTAAAGVIAALGALVAQWRHANGPAHQPPSPGPGQPPAGPGPASG